jgi:hypothetical protein
MPPITPIATGDHELPRVEAPPAGDRHQFQLAHQVLAADDVVRPKWTAPPRQHHADRIDVRCAQEGQQQREVMCRPARAAGWQAMARLPMRMRIS